MAVPEALKKKYLASLDARSTELASALRGATNGDADAHAALCALLHKMKGEAQLLGLVLCGELVEKMEAIAKLRREAGMRAQDAAPIDSGIAVLREMGTNDGRSEALEDALTALMLHGRALRAGSTAP